MSRLGLEISLVYITDNLPDDDVSSTSINMFKNRLDLFFHALDIYYNWEAHRTGIGDHSINDYNADFDN